MSELYNNIPPDRRDAYLANAEEAFDEATKPLIERATQDLGRAVVTQAELITKGHAEAVEQLGRDADTLAEAHKLGDEAEAYAREHDMTAELRTELNSPNAMNRLNVLSAADMIKTNRMRSDVNPGGVQDFNLHTGLGKSVEAVEGADAAVQNPADLVVANGLRPDLPGNDFSQAINKLG